MPRAHNQEVHISPIKGLITESGPFTYPENAFTEGYDIKLSIDGRMKRRKGFEYETSYATESATITSTSIVHEFVWKTAGGSGNNNFLVVQLGINIWFYDIGTFPISGNKHATTISLNTFATAGSSNIESEYASFVNGDGVLFVFHSQCEPFFITYDEDTNTLTASQIDIKIRDLDGVEDTLEVAERPTSLTDLHNYNLDNQGWADVVNDHATGSSTVDPLDEWFSDRSDYPSNADVWWYYRDANNQYDPANWVDRVDIGNTPAPKGHFLLNPFSEDRTAVSGVSNIPTVTTDGKRPSTGAFFAGRVWCAGVSKYGWNSTLYFSQIVLDSRDYGKCYQSNDPTSSEQSDLLSSDGGTIVIQDCGTIIFLHTVQNFLIVFASNGVWTISGSEGTGFKATDFSVSKISEFSIVGHHNIISIDGLPLWWNTDGIYKLNIDSQLGSISVVSITDTTIQTFINNIPDSEKQYIKASYNSLDKTITWLYRTTASTNERSRSEYDAALMVHTQLQAFYPWTIKQPASGPRIHGCFDTSSEPGNETETYFLTLVETATDTYNVTLSKEHDTSYLDWVTFDATGTDYSSYVIMGYALSGRSMLKFTNNYILFLTDKLTNSSCVVRGIWGYADDEASNRFSTGQDIYPAKSNFGIQERKLKIRGSGRSVQLKFESVKGKPFSLISWAVWVLMNSTP